MCKKSKFRHCEQFTENQREEIFKQFWKSNWDEKKTYISNVVTKKVVNRSRVLDENSRRQNTYNYHPKYQNSDGLQVCKQMFLATLGVNEWMVHNWIKESTHGMPNKNSTLMQCSDSEIDEEQNNISFIRSSLNNRKLDLEAWIQKLPKMPSHYCPLQSKRLYLEGPFDTKQEVYDLYAKHCNEKNMRPLSKSFLFEFLEENNFAIYKPRKDQCDLCTSYKMKQITEEEYQNHKNMKDRAQVEKKMIKLFLKMIVFVLPLPWICNQLNCVLCLKQVLFTTP